MDEIVVSWAQNREDIVLRRALGDIVGGTYVDVGAADPEEDSVTKLFYDSGWSGLNVEPVAAYAERLRTQRDRDVTVQACAGAAPGKATFHVIADTGLSTLDDDAAKSAAAAGRVVTDAVVDVVTLNELLETAGFEGREIHFLKIDVEGFEPHVLAGLDRTRWRPWVIVVEATAPNSTEQVHERWEPDLLASGYDFCLFDGINRFYVAHEHEDRAVDLSYPVCALDPPFITATASSGMNGWSISASHRRALENYEELLASAQNLERDLGETRASYQVQEQELLHTTAAYERQAAELRALASQCETLRSGVVEMTAELDRIRDGWQQERTKRESVEFRLSEAQRSIDVLHRSTSWRLTRPVRVVMDQAKSMLRRTAL